jgi:hypothetical protein
MMISFFFLPLATGTASVASGAAAAGADMQGSWCGEPTAHAQPAWGSWLHY